MLVTIGKEFNILLKLKGLDRHYEQRRSRSINRRDCWMPINADTKVYMNNASEKVNVNFQPDKYENEIVETYLNFHL